MSTSTSAAVDQVGINDEPARDLRLLALSAGCGDESALSELIRLTSKRVWWACAALVDRDSADDLAQETYLRTVRSLPGYRGDADPHSWLLTIARRVCAEEIARRQRCRQTVSRLAADRRVSVVEPMVNIEIGDAISRLPRRQREAFVLTAVAGFSYAETATVLDCPVGTVRSRVARAREQLIGSLGPVRRCLNEECADDAC